MDNAFYRQQMMQKANMHSGIDNRTLTQESINTTEGQKKLKAEIDKIVNEANRDKKIKSDSLFFKFVRDLFVNAAQTRDGKIQAVNMAIWAVESINKKFEIKEK